MKNLCYLQFVTLKDVTCYSVSNWVSRKCFYFFSQIIVHLLRDRTKNVFLVRNCDVHVLELGNPPPQQKHFSSACTIVLLNVFENPYSLNVDDNTANYQSRIVKSNN